jgi:hypothetical protein
MPKHFWKHFLKMAVFCIVVPCIALVTKATSSSETSAIFYPIKLGIIPEDGHHHNHRREILKSQITPVSNSNNQKGLA